jgi:aminopeptidase N
LSDHRSFALPDARANYGPDKDVAVLHIALDLRPDIARRRLDGRATTTVRAIEDRVALLALDAVDLQIAAVRREDGTPMPFVSTSSQLRITVEPPLHAGETLTFEVAYAVESPQRGLYFIEHEPRHVWTQSQDSDARSWFPCFDYPAEKQTTSTRITVPNGQFALGNGALVERIVGSDETTFVYEQRVPHSTYLVTMVAGPFSEIEQQHARVHVWYYVLPGREADGERAFVNTPRMIDVFERVIGVPYPYERYSQIAVADFIFGGMENTSATTQTDRVLPDERANLDASADFLVSHELAHQWFGDLVTCRDWSQAWLNEGFATYFEAVWLEADKGWDEYVYEIFGLVQRYLEEDAERYRRPIVCNVFRDPIELFDRHLYEKGGAVLHMLRGDLGWSRLQRSLARYVGDNAYRTVETIDLIRAIEAETGRNLRAFFAQWVERSGHPELDVSYRWDAERSVALVTVKQTQRIADDAPAYAFDLDLGFVAELPSSIATDAGDGPLPGETRVRMAVSLAVHTFAIPLAAQPALVRVDPSGWILADWTSSLGADLHAAALRADPSPILRVRAAQALAKDSTRVGREALAAALAHDPFWAVAVEAAAALGETRAPSARAALIANTTHANPKVRRAVAEALGAFREADAADALLALREDASYRVIAQAYHALGRTRDPRAFEALRAGVERPSWNETIAVGALRGLGALADERARDILIAACAADHPEAMRRAAIVAFAELAVSVDAVRASAVEATLRALRDDSILVRVAANAAAEKIADVRLLPTLDRLAVSDTDGRLRRDAAEAAIRIRERQSKPAELATLREEVAKLRTALEAMRERIDSTQP